MFAINFNIDSFPKFLSGWERVCVEINGEHFI